MPTRFLLALPCLLLAARAAAQTPPPRISQEIVVTATVAPAPLASLGPAVTVLTGDDLRHLGILSIADALRLVPGVDAQARGARDVQTDFSIRGATFGQSLITIDGVRLNDSQSGHHNGDIPVPLAGVERIEIVNGGASAVHGADAFGGTINVITRTSSHAELSLSAGQHGYAGVQGSWSGGAMPVRWAVTAWGGRSSGFVPDRDYAMGGGGARGTLPRGWTIDARAQKKAFGADQFYGPSPSKEWTDQTLLSAAWQATHGAWMTGVATSWRNHGDDFRWDRARPGYFENIHRTNAAQVDALASRAIGQTGRFALGAAAGADWIRSSNLGDHDYGHGSVFAEAQLPVSARMTVQAGLRVDGYSTFGTSASPSAAAAFHASPAIKLRGSLARAFRIPTFTERYYHDPANLGSPDLRPEHGWAFDGGVDWMLRGWTLSASSFARWDRDVIDWLRPSSADLWRSTNVRDVTSRGVEIAASRRWGQALLRGFYTGQSVTTPPLAMQSKYVLGYARHSAGAAIAAPVGRLAVAAITVDVRDRLDGQRYAIIGARVSRRIRRASLYVDATNLFDVDYREIAGVRMPGRWLGLGVQLQR